MLSKAYFEYLQENKL